MLRIWWARVLKSKASIWGGSTGANSRATFSDGKVAANVEGHRLVQVNKHDGVVTGDDHLPILRQADFAGYIRGPEKELQLVATEERRMPSPFFFAQDIHFTFELRPRSRHNLTSLDLIGLDAS